MPKIKFKVVTVGGVTEDITFYTRDGVIMENQQDIFHQRLLCFEYGAKIKIDKSQSFFGGGAGNAAVTFSRQGIKTAIMTCVGRDARAKKIIAHLKKEKIYTGYIKTTNKDETGYSFVLVGRDNEHIIFSDRAANAYFKFTNDEIKYLDQAEWVYLTTLSGKWREKFHYIFKTKAKIAWNPGRRQILEGYSVIGKYFPRTEVLMLNKDEAIELVSSDPKYVSMAKTWFLDEVNLLHVMKDWGAGIAVITLGAEGAKAYDGHRIYFQSAIRQSDIINTTGAGDAFGSAFVAGLMRYKGDISQAMKLAALNSASVLGHEGAQTGILRKKDLKL